MHSSHQQEMAARASAQAEASGMELDEELDSLDEQVLQDLDDDLDDTVSLEAQTVEANSTGLSLSELDELLAEEDWEPVDSLDALLSESVEAAAAAKRAKSLKQRIRTGQARPAEVEAYKAWEAQAHWKPIRNCEVWNQVTCLICNTKRRFFSELMVEYQGLGNPDNLRYVTVREANPGLPGGFKFILRDAKAMACDSCHGAGGIDWDNATIWKA